jgi:hypothetical protein
MLTTHACNWYRLIVQRRDEGVSNSTIVCSKAWKMTLLVIFSDEANFHLIGKINRLQYPREVLQHERHSLKLNEFYAFPQAKVYEPFFFMRPRVTGQTYREVLQKLLLS